MTVAFDLDDPVDRWPFEDIDEELIPAPVPVAAFIGAIRQAIARDLDYMVVPQAWAGSFLLEAALLGLGEPRCGHCEPAWVCSTVCWHVCLQALDHDGGHAGVYHPAPTFPTVEGIHDWENRPAWLLRYGPDLTTHEERTNG